jgi:hypothetical protein
MRSLPPSRYRNEMMQGSDVDQARSGTLLRLFSDFGPQLISESVFRMAPGMNRRGPRRAKLILHQMRRRAYVWRFTNMSLVLLWITEKVAVSYPKDTRDRKTVRRDPSPIMWIAHIEQEFRPAQVLGTAQAATRRE